MERQINEETAYKMTLHVNELYRYASTRPRVITEEGVKNSNRSILWGTVAEDFKFMPNTNSYTFHSKNAECMYSPRTVTLAN